MVDDAGKNTFQVNQGQFLCRHQHFKSFTVLYTFGAYISTIKCFVQVWAFLELHVS